MPDKRHDDSPAPSSQSGTPAQGESSVEIQAVAEQKRLSRLRGTIDHLNLISTAFARSDTWSLPKLRLEFGERNNAESGLRMFALLGFADRVASGTYRINSLGREFTASPNRATRQAILRQALLESPDFRPYWMAIAANFQEVGSHEIKTLLKERFGFPDLHARNYASMLVHWAFRAGLLARAPGGFGRYLVRSPTEPAQLQIDQETFEIDSLPGLTRQLDRLVIKLGRFLARQDLLVQKELRHELSVELGGLPAGIISNGNRELLEILQDQARVAMEKPDIKQVQLLYRHLDHLSKRLLKDTSKERGGPH